MPKKKSKKKLTCRMYCDGASRGNPGPASVGIVMYLKQGKKKEVITIAERIGNHTNNFAEYMAVVTGLKRAKKLGVTHISIKTDSMLVVNQLGRGWKVKSEHNKNLFLHAIGLLTHFEAWKIDHVYRRFNTVADGLANQILDVKTLETIKSPNGDYMFLNGVKYARQR